MSKLIIGDTSRCVDTGGNWQLTIDAAYTIAGVSGEFVRVLVKDKLAWYRAEYFEMVPDARLEPDATDTDMRDYITEYAELLAIAAESAKRGIHGLAWHTELSCCAEVLRRLQVACELDSNRKVNDWEQV